MLTRAKIILKVQICPLVDVFVTRCSGVGDTLSLTPYRPYQKRKRAAPCSLRCNSTSAFLLRPARIQLTSKQLTISCLAEGGYYVVWQTLIEKLSTIFVSGFLKCNVFFLNKFIFEVVIIGKPENIDCGLLRDRSFHFHTIAYPPCLCTCVKTNLAHLALTPWGYLYSCTFGRSKEKGG